MATTPHVSSAIYSKQKVSLLVTHAPAPLRHGNGRMSVLCLMFLTVILVTALNMARAQGKTEAKPVAGQTGAASGKNTFVMHCASCHGTDGEGHGPAAIAMKTPPADLTTLTRRHQGKYPAGYVGAVLKFGRSLASHGSEEMPVWGSRFKELDPVRDPTGQQHVDDVVAYIGSLQPK
jgi:mono/diheme cytochrome c family protein